MIRTMRDLNSQMICEKKTWYKFDQFYRHFGIQILWGVCFNSRYHVLDNTQIHVCYKAEKNYFKGRKVSRIEISYNFHNLHGIISKCKVGMYISFHETL